MTDLDRQPPRPDSHIMHIVDGQIVDPRDYNTPERVVRFMVRPFVEAWHHRDLILAILRRELRERFSGSMAGWVWAVVAPLISLVTYTLVFGGSGRLPNGKTAASSIDYAMFIFGGLVAFNFFTEMAYRAPSLLHEYAHYIKQTMFPAEMLPIISTLRAMTYATIGLTVMMLCQLVFERRAPLDRAPAAAVVHPLPAFLMGITWLLSAMGAFTRDTAYLMMTIAPVLMFATPVFFSHEAFSPEHAAADVRQCPDRLHRDHSRPRRVRQAARPTGRGLDAVRLPVHVLVRLLVLPPPAGRDRRCHLSPKS